MKWKKKGHEFDDLGNRIKGKNLLIYGAGVWGQAFAERIKSRMFGPKLEGFIDQRWEEIGSCMGYPVYSPEAVLDPDNRNYIVIVKLQNESIRQEVMNRFLSAGYILGMDLIEEDVLFYSLYNVYVPVYELYTNNKLIVSSTCVIPSDVCNLNCKNCLNFTPKIQRFKTRKLKEVCEDVDLYFDTIDYVEEFQISGGEPLLYGELKELVDYIGRNYRGKIGCFETVLNGTVIPDDDFCKIAKKQDLILILDDYRDSILAELDKRKEILEKIKQYELQWSDNHVAEWFDLDIEGTDNHNMTEIELAEYFTYCNNPWNCYENGKFYLCNFSWYAQKAGFHSEPETSSFDIHQLSITGRRELLEFLHKYSEKGYVELCKNCSGWGPNNKKKRIPVAVQVKR